MAGGRASPDHLVQGERLVAGDRARLLVGDLGQGARRPRSLRAPLGALGAGAGRPPAAAPQPADDGGVGLEELPQGGEGAGGGPLLVAEVVVCRGAPLVVLVVVATVSQGQGEKA